MMRRVLVIIAALVGIALVNVVAWQAVQSAPLPTIAGDIPSDSHKLDWSPFMTMKPDAAGQWQIPDELAALEGKRVTVDGVLFTMPQFKTGNTMKAAVLTPPSRFGCCGLQCSTKPQLMMLCVLTAPMTTPTEKTVVARATGILRFNRTGDAWTMSELEQAKVTIVP